MFLIFFIGGNRKNMFAEGKRCVNGTWVLFFTFVEIPWMGLARFLPAVSLALCQFLLYRAQNTECYLREKIAATLALKLPLKLVLEPGY